VTATCWSKACGDWRKHGNQNAVQAIADLLPDALTGTEEDEAEACAEASDAGAKIRHLEGVLAQAPGEPGALLRNRFARELKLRSTKRPLTLIDVGDRLSGGTGANALATLDRNLYSGAEPLQGKAC
jgi:hypothetical protein